MRTRHIPMGTRLDYWIDALLLVAWLVDDSFRFTGLTIHEWIGFGLAPILVLHLTLHWDWVLRTTRRIAGAFPARERLRWLVDLLLLGAMAACVTSGLLISRAALPAIGWTPAGGRYWTGLHTTTADLTVVLVAVHLGLNWPWIVSVTRRMFGRRRRPVAA